MGSSPSDALATATEYPRRARGGVATPPPPLEALGPAADAETSESRAGRAPANASGTAGRPTAGDGRLLATDARRSVAISSRFSSSRAASAAARDGDVCGARGGGDDASPGASLAGDRFDGLW